MVRPELDPAPEAGRAVAPRLVELAATQEQDGESLMCLHVLGIERERALEVLASGGDLAVVDQQAGEVDVRGRVLRVVLQGLGEREPGGAAEAGAREQGAQVVERRNVRGHAREQRDIRRACFLVLAQPVEQTGLVEELVDLRAAHRPAARRSINWRTASMMRRTGASR
jgi:hypothetical protein